MKSLVNSFTPKQFMFLNFVSLSLFFMVFITLCETSNRFQLVVYKNFYDFFGHLITLSLQQNIVHYLNHSFSTSRSARWAENTIRQHEGIKYRNIFTLQIIEHRTQFCSQCKVFSVQISQCVDEYSWSQPFLHQTDLRVRNWELRWKLYTHLALRNWQKRFFNERIFL